jgi:hypothetical protein
MKACRMNGSGRGARALLLGALVAPLAACGEESAHILATRQPVSAAAAVHATIVAPELVRHGMELPIAVQLTNPGMFAVTLAVLGTPQQPAFDIWLTAADGTRVWQLHPTGQPPAGAATTQITLAGGSFLSLPATWDLRVGTGEFIAPGTYRIDAHVLTPTGAIRATPASILIAP